MAQYSGQLRLDRKTSEPTNEQYASAKFDISFSLLHDVILLEVRSFVMKYEAMKRKKSREKIDNLQREIDKIQNSPKEEDRARVENLKEKLQKVEDECEKEKARRYFAKINLEGERPTKFFCSMNKRMKSKAQFETIHVKERNERGEEVIMVVTKQSEVEWEVRKFYWSLYRKDATMCDKRDILDRIGISLSLIHI